MTPAVRRRPLPGIPSAPEAPLPDGAKPQPPSNSWAALGPDRPGRQTARLRRALRCLLGAGLLSLCLQAAAPDPLARWTFAEDARDVMGVMDGFLEGGAAIANGRLILNGSDAYLQTAALPVDVTEKTLTAWVAVNPLTQGGGGVISLQTSDGETFDAIVYAERQARKWVAGSDFWRRTQDVDAPQETAENVLVHLALVYRADNSIALYRNGEPYGAPYAPASPVMTYPAGFAQVLLGMRHGISPGGDRMFRGEIDEAALYDRALTATEIAALVAERSLRFTEAPQDVAAFVGESRTLRALAVGDPTPTYQWWKNNAPLTGATDPELTFPSLTLGDAGSYHVVATSGSQSATSATARVTVYLPIENHLVGHWRLNETTGLIAADATPNRLDGTLLNFWDETFQWTPGRVGNGLALFGTERVEVHSPLFNLDSFTAALWLRVDELGAQMSPISRERASNCESWGLEVRPTGQLNFFVFGATGFVADVQSSVNVEPGTFHHVVVTYHHADSRPDLYLDGQLVSSTRGRGPDSGPPGYDASPLTFGRRLGACTYPEQPPYVVDEIQLYDRVLNASEVTYLFDRPGDTLPADPLLPPAITRQPEGASLVIGGSVTFRVEAAGTAPLAYQWTKDGVPLAGATAAELTITDAQPDDAGQYAVVVTNALGTTTSAAVSLRVFESGSGLIARWTFDTDARDVVGSMHGTLEGGATLVDGRLVLDGVDSFLRTDPLPMDLSEKTLAAWVVVNPLSQAGGGVLTVQSGDGETFDAIVFGERQPQRWMAGSDNWRRTQDVDAAPETVEGARLHIAIVYDENQRIALYRGGQPYGAPYVAGSPLVTYTAGDGHVLIGMRHGLALVPARLFQGEVDEASLYNRALTPGEIATLAGTAVPQLRFARDGNSLTLSWSAELTGFLLEQTDTLPGSTWTSVAGVVNNQVTVNAGTGHAYFRLRQSP